MSASPFGRLFADAHIMTPVAELLDVRPNQRRSTAPVRVVLIGCGAISESLHLPVLAGHERLHLSALVDRSLERAERFASGYGVKTAVRDVADLEAGSFDAAIIATPPVHH